MEDICKAAVGILAKFLLCACVAAVVFGCIDACNRKPEQVTSPVEEIHVIDSLKLDNDKLVLEIGTIDSIKHVKVVEVKNLDNDSTLKLFYELIRE